MSLHDVPVGRFILKVPLRIRVLYQSPFAFAHFRSGGCELASQRGTTSAPPTCDVKAKGDWYYSAPLPNEKISDRSVGSFALRFHRPRQQHDCDQGEDRVAREIDRSLCPDDGLFGKCRAGISQHRAATCREGV